MAIESFRMQINQLAHLSWVAIDEMRKDQAVVVLPIGAVEQHGPHLPIGTDSLMAEELLEKILERHPSWPVYRLPLLPYGKSNEHLGFPGTFSLSAATLRQVVWEIAEGVIQAGFRKLILFNTHGGNRSTLETLCRDLRAEKSLWTFYLFPPGLAPDPTPGPPEEQRLDIHAGDWETSVMMHLQPHLVQIEKAPRSLPEWPSSLLGLGSGAASLGWLTRDWSPSGVWGNAQAASPERGQQRVEAMLERLTEVLEAIVAFQPEGV